MRKQKRIMICFCLLLGMSMVGCGVLKGFDAEAYTEAVLKNTYDVNVDIYPTDIFVTFSEKLKHPADEMIQKAENGEYKGTEEEIKTQMQSEFLEYSYTLLEESFEGAQNGKKETVVLTISNKEKKGFAVEEESFSNFLTAILRLDEVK